MATWLALAALVAAYLAHDVFGLGGSGADEFFDLWVNTALLWAAAAVCLAGALRTARGRVAWVLVAIALACWATGDTIWAIRYADSTTDPILTISDFFWLAWYPLIVASLALLVRDRVPAFELHRWIDGVVVMLVVATPWVALFLQPVAEESGADALAEAVEFAYPLGDMVMVGAALGVCALLAWRPGRMWLLFGLGLAVIGISDAVYAVQSLEQAYRPGVTTDAVWAIGALLIAWASWQPHPGRLEVREMTGWPAIALPLAAQVLAVGIQAYGYFHELPKSERVLTIAVLLIAIVQIVITRPPKRRASSPAA